MKILVSAYACNPYQGTEPGIGWNFAYTLASKGIEVHCLVRKKDEKDIKSFLIDKDVRNIQFHYISLSSPFENFWKYGGLFLGWHYTKWLRESYVYAKGLEMKEDFDFVHHITYATFKFGSHLHKLNKPFIFGPLGGGQVPPTIFKDLLGSHWKKEIARKIAAELFYKYNPLCKASLTKAKHVLVSNRETFEIAKRIRGNESGLSIYLDAAIPDDFMPSEMPVRASHFSETVKFLWVGKMLAWKGLKLVLVALSKSNKKNFSLTIVGEGADFEDNFDGLIEEFGLKGRVHWLGKVAHREMRAFYAQSDVFIYTSLRESNGVQLAEAMSFGLPILTLDLHGQSVLVPSSAGWKIPVTTYEKVVEDLTFRIESILSMSDRSILNELGNNGYEFAKSLRWSYKVEQIINQFYDNA